MLLIEVFSEKRDDKDQTGDQKEQAACHRPEMPDTGDHKTGRGEGEQDPSQKIDLAVCNPSVPIGFSMKAKAHGCASPRLRAQRWHSAWATATAHAGLRRSVWGMARGDGTNQP